MRSTELARRMHAVLDGEATPGEVDALQRTLAASPAARDEFDRLQRLFDALDGMPREHAPEGLVAAVTAALPAIPHPGEASDQLSPAPGVLRPSSARARPTEAANLQQEDQPFPPQRRSAMTQPHPPYSAKRKALFGGGIAIVAAIIVWQYGFDSTPRAEDVAGTVVPAQRYRAAQGGAADIRLGDQTVAQLMHNDAFVKLVRDPQVQALVREPGFLAAAQILQNSPEMARLMLERSDTAQRLAASPEMLQAMERNAASAHALERAVAAAAALQASPQAGKLLAENAALARYVRYLAAMERSPISQRLAQAEAAQALALNAEQAQRFAMESATMERALNVQALQALAAENSALQNFLSAREEAARLAQQYQEAARALQANAAAAQLLAMDRAAANALLFNPQAAHVAALSPAALQTLAAYPEAARALLATPEASRYLLQSPEAARLAMESVAAEHSAERAVKMEHAAERAHKADRAVKMDRVNK